MSGNRFCTYGGRELGGRCRSRKAGWTGSYGLVPTGEKDSALPCHLDLGQDQRSCSGSYEGTLQEVYRERFERVFKTITVDNGSEFAESMVVRKRPTSLIRIAPPGGTD